jgi:hypothetical protein
VPGSKWCQQQQLFHVVHAAACWAQRAFHSCPDCVSILLWLPSCGRKRCCLSGACEQRHHFGTVGSADKALCSVPHIRTPLGLFGGRRRMIQLSLAGYLPGYLASKFSVVFEQDWGYTNSYNRRYRYEVHTDTTTAAFTTALGDARFKK